MTSHRSQRGASLVSKSMISAGTLTSTSPLEESLSLQQTQAPFFPFKLTATLSALKIVSGCVLVGLAAAAIIQNAGLAWKAAGIVGGILVIISGVLGAYSVRTGATRPYVILFLLSCLTSLLASVTVIIYSATGLARDANTPFTEGQERKEAAMLINTVLIIVSFLDIIFSLPSIIISLRELCNCYNPELLLHQTGPRKEWLMSWLGQQPPVFYSPASGIPYAKMPGHGSPYRGLASRTSPAFLQIPSEHSQSASRQSPRDGQARQNRPRQRSKSPSHRHQHQHQHQHHQHQHQHSHQHPHHPHHGYHAPVHGVAHHHPHHHHPHQSAAHYSAYAPIEIFAPMYPGHHFPASPGSHLIAAYPHHGGHHGHPVGPVGPVGWVLGPPDWDQTVYQERRQPERTKRSRSKSHSRSGLDSKRKKTRIAGGAGGGPTDSDIEKTYTGRDRELAEEFIEQTMEARTGTESEAW